MAHNTLTRPGGWTGVTVLPADLASLDAKQSSGINGDAGGTYAPATVVYIGGQGLRLTGPLQLTNGAHIENGASTFYTLADNDYPELAVGHVGTTRTLMQSMLRSHGTVPGLLWPDRNGGGVQTLAPSVLVNGTATTPELFCPLRVANGSTLAQVTFTFAVGASRTLPPAVMPRFRVERVDAAGAVVALGGWQSPPRAASAGAWYANGAVQSYVYVCDPNVIDISAYSYRVHVVDEVPGGATVTEQVALVTADVALTSGVTPSGVGSVQDGVTLTAGMRVWGSLGVQRVNVGPWDYPYDWQPALLRQWTSVAIKQGTINAGTYRQVTGPPPYVDALGNPLPLTASQVPIPHGTRFISTTALFTGITDTRWQ